MSFVIIYYSRANKNKAMYNIHQYNNEVRMQQQIKSEEERYAKYLLKHEGTPNTIQISRKKQA